MGQAQKGGPSSEIELRVRYAETDQMGRAYYGAYFTWFEVGRVELLRNLGATYAELEAQGYFLPVVEAHARYVGPARYDEVVVLTTRLGQVGKSRVEFHSVVTGKDSGAVLAEGRVVLACTGADGRPRRLPESVAARIDGERGRTGCTG